MTVPIWPFEVLVSLGSPSWRLGDLIASTQLEIAEREDMQTILKNVKGINSDNCPSGFWLLRWVISDCFGILKVYYFPARKYESITATLG